MASGKNKREKGNLTAGWKDADSLRASRNSNTKAGLASLQSLCKLADFFSSSFWSNTTAALNSGNEHVSGPPLSISGL